MAALVFYSLAVFVWISFKDKTKVTVSVVCNTNEHCFSLMHECTL